MVLCTGQHDLGQPERAQRLRVPLSMEHRLGAPVVATRETEGESVVHLSLLGRCETPARRR